MNLNTPLFVLAAAASLATIGPATAHAFSGNLTYNFVQVGYRDGATITGSFTGADEDGNGILVHFPRDVPGGFPIEVTELSAMSIHFSGNSASPAFDLDLDDLFGFVYEIDSAGLGDDPAYDPTIMGDLTEGIGAIGPEHFYTSGLGPNRFLGGYIGGAIDLDQANDPADNAVDSSSQLVQVTRVPEPAAATLLLGAAIAGSLRRRILRGPTD
jgi:hypothetical protein